MSSSMKIATGTSIQIDGTKVNNKVQSPHKPFKNLWFKKGTVHPSMHFLSITYIARTIPIPENIIVNVEIEACTMNNSKIIRKFMLRTSQVKQKLKKATIKEFQYKCNIPYPRPRVVIQQAQSERLKMCRPV
jgi:hypothetical protein